MEFKIYKRGQGHHTRLWSAIILFAVVAVGCYRLHQELAALGNPWIQNFVPAGLAAAAALAISWVSNRPNVADFLIASEGEIKKVSWSSRKEIVASTTVVIIVVIFFGIMLTAADTVFAWLLTDVNTLNIYNLSDISPK
ncbi:MAG: preprotein translocase subunit SecE [Sedimentisphaerales bacterium]|nr:preprotein translocase subunit SecE [Sedimentisphaerales bacterium]